MKKIIMMIAALAMTTAMQAQTKFHDVEANEAKGAVKTLTQEMMGMSTTINFSEDGKMSSADFSDAVYDNNGYLQSVKRNMQGQSITLKYIWENGRLKGQSFDMMGQDAKSTYNYDDKGIVTSSTTDFGGQQMETPYTDYKFDDHGNWISRKMSMMGQEMTVTRSFTYYE